MTPSAAKGNNPERWEKLLDYLDQKLQLGLLDHLKRITSYHFEEETLYVVPGSEKDLGYLSRPAVLQQFEILAQDALKLEKVKIRKE